MDKATLKQILVSIGVALSVAMLLLVVSTHTTPKTEYDNYGHLQSIHLNGHVESAQVSSDGTLSIVVIEPVGSSQEPSIGMPKMVDTARLYNQIRVDWFALAYMVKHTTYPGVTTIGIHFMTSNHVEITHSFVKIGGTK